MRQYALPFKPDTSYREENFYLSGCNQHAFSQVKKWPEWKALLLSGPSGSGKTHLGHMWAGHAQAAMVDCKQEKLSPEKIVGHCLIENIEAADERNLLHCINIAKERGFSLLLTSLLPAKQLSFTLPDLTSRLAAMPAAAIAAPDDEALKGVMRKQFADRQIGIDEEVLQYLLTHQERSFSAIAATVAILDQAMWQEKKKLTIPFIRKLLAESASA